MSGQQFNFSNTTPAPPANAAAIQIQNDSSNPPNFSWNLPSGVGGGANIVAKKILTAQSAAQSAVLLFATPSNGAGFYRVHYVATITTVDGTSCVLGGANGFQLIFTNANGDAVVKTQNPTTPVISAVNNTGTTISGEQCGYAAASSNINFSFGYTGVGGQMRYDLAVFVEYVGA